MMMTFASSAGTPELPPTRLFFLLGAAFLCYLYWRFDPKRDRGADAGDPSPTEKVTPPRPRDAQVRAVSSHVSPDAEADETVGAPSWWGRIVQDGRGGFRRVYQSARHIAETGEKAPRELSAPDDDMPVDDEPDDVIDLALDDTSAHHEGAIEEYAPTVRRESREEYAARCLDAGAEKADIVKALQEHYGLSRAHAYRVVGGAEPRQVA